MCDNSDLPEPAAPAVPIRARPWPAPPRNEEEREPELLREEVLAAFAYNTPLVI
jgi:hypothetical protein